MKGWGNKRRIRREMRDGERREREREGERRKRRPFPIWRSCEREFERESDGTRVSPKAPNLVIW